MSAPGAGKTTLLERVLGRASTACAPACSRATCRAASTPTGSPRCTCRSSQLNTDAASAASATSTRTWSARRCRALPLDELDLLVIENVGNLVCPAEFRVGEDARIMVSSVTEGEDKPLKYPLMFRACELVVVNKIDLLAHLDFDLDRFLHHLDAVHPGVERMLVSARTGEGVDALRDWLAGAAARAREPPRDAAAHRRRPRRRSPARAEANERVLRGRGRRARAAVPPDGRALRARRAAARVRGDAGRALGRPPRRRRVRAPGDRRQARAAGDRAGRRGRRSRAARAGRRARRHRDRLRRAARVGRRGARAARLPHDRLRARRAPSGSSCRRPTTRSSRQELVETLYHVLWELVHVFFEHRGLLEGRDARPCTTPARRASSTRSSASARTDLDAVLADVRALGAR